MELWLPTQGYPHYEVSNNGRVRSFRNRQGSGLDSIPHLLTPRLQKHVRYLTVSMVNAARQKKTVTVHRLVIEAFHGPCPEGLQCAHLDGNNVNNHSENLSWCSSKENHHQRIEHGKTGIGEKNGRAKLSKIEVIEMHERRLEGETLEALGQKYGVQKAAVWKIVHGHSWKHLNLGEI